MRAKEFLIQCETGIGNAVLLTPLIDALYKEFPTCKIDLLNLGSAIGSDILEGDKRIRSILRELPNRPYTCFYNPYWTANKKVLLRYKLRFPFSKIRFHVHFRSLFLFRVAFIFCLLFRVKLVQIQPNIHEARSNLNLYDARSPEIKLPQFILPKAALTPSTRLQKFLKNPYIVLQVGTTHAVQTPKTWPLAHWQSLIDRLSDLPMSIILVGSSQERALADQLKGGENLINLVGETSFSALKKILYHAKLVVGGDSGTTHISAALQQLTLVLWGPSNYERSRQLGTQVHFINLHLPCSPCIGNHKFGGQTDLEAIQSCPFDIACMRDISPDQVAKKIGELLGL